MSTMLRNVTVSRIDVATAEVERIKDVVAMETPLHVFLGAIHLVSILCSPSKLKELVVGHLLGEGLVSSANEIKSINFDGNNRCYVALQRVDVEERIVVSKPFAQLIVSACGSVGYKSLSELLDRIELKPLPFWQVEAKTVLKGVRQLNVLGENFRRTGGVHVAALFKRVGELAVLTEDVGRHNAVDKIVGEAALKGENLSKCFLVLSGRLSGDIVLKAARVGIPVVASLAAAVDSGVEVAEKVRVTLAGFARGNRMIVYAHPERIRF